MVTGAEGLANDAARHVRGERGGRVLKLAQRGLFGLLDLFLGPLDVGFGVLAGGGRRRWTMNTEGLPDKPLVLTARSDTLNGPSAPRQRV